MGDSITTDDITPAGSWLKYRSNVPKYSEAVFCSIDPDFHKKAAEYRDQGKANMVVAGEGYGEGSSREHAALCPMYLGVKAIIAKGFQRIHADNLVNFGIIPLTFKNESDYGHISQDDKFEIPDIRDSLQKGKKLYIKNETQGTKFEVEHNLSDRQKDIILAGGTLEYVKKTK